jgi:signal transduction histidine kinase
LATLANHLQDVVQEKNELLDIAAHDLKNPLTAISLTASLVEAHGASMARHDLENYMSDINRSAANMVEIIERLVLVNTLETGNTVLSCCAVDIGALAHEVVEAYAVRARAKQLTLQHALPSHPLLALSDRTATRIVLDNLISNAVKYSPPGRSIDIRVHSSAGVVRVEIADQGPGLTHDDQQRLFRKYARLSAKPTANEQSTGVGLSIVKSLVTRMNGRVWCESAIGQGATFIVELPSADTAAAPAAAQSTLVAPEP